MKSPVEPATFWLVAQCPNQMRHRPHLLRRRHPWYSFLLEAESTRGPWCGRKDYVNDTIGNRNHDLRALSAVTQPTAPPRAPAAGNVVNFNLPVCRWQMARKTHLMPHCFSFVLVFHCYIHKTLIRYILYYSSCEGQLRQIG